MTVAAVVLVPGLETALADAHGEPALRRVLQSAWAGGALPLVVSLPPDADEAAYAETLADIPATVTRASSDLPHGVGRFVAGLDVAAETVSETTAGLLWPVRYGWVDPETVTSLVEAHGGTPGAILRPAYHGRPGFPVLVPVELGNAIAGDPRASGADAIDAAIAAGVPARTIELGDPGIAHDLATAWTDLPEFEGPDRPRAVGASEP